MDDQEFKFYDEIYHPQTGGWPQGELFKQAFAEYQRGEFDAKRASERLAAELR